MKRRPGLVPERRSARSCRLSWLQRRPAQFKPDEAGILAVVGHAAPRDRWLSVAQRFRPQILRSAVARVRGTLGAAGEDQRIVVDAVVRHALLDAVLNADDSRCRCWDRPSRTDCPGPSRSTAENSVQQWSLMQISQALCRVLRIAAIGRAERVAAIRSAFEGDRGHPRVPRGVRSTGRVRGTGGTGGRRCATRAGGRVWGAAIAAPAAPPSSVLVVTVHAEPTNALITPATAANYECQDSVHPSPDTGKQAANTGAPIRYTLAVDEIFVCVEMRRALSQGGPVRYCNRLGYRRSMETGNARCRAQQG